MSDDCARQRADLKEAEPCGRPGRRWLRLILQVLSLALFGLLLWSGGLGVWRQILGGDWGSILAAFVITGMGNMFSAIRLQLVAQSLMGRGLAPWRRFYYLTMSARALGLVVPRGVSTLGGKSVGLRALGVPVSRALWIVLIDNLLDVILLGVLVVPGVCFLQGWISAGSWALLASSLVLGLAGALWYWGTAERLLPFYRLLDYLPLPRLKSALRLEPATLADLLPARETMVRGLGLSVLLNVALALRFYLIARAVGLDLSWPVFVASFPITQLSLVFAVTPGGLGVFDAGWYGLLLMAGALSTEALTFVVAQRAYIFVFVLVWAGFSTLLSLTVEVGRGG